MTHHYRQSARSQTNVAALDAEDSRIRNLLTRFIVLNAREPSVEEIAVLAGSEPAKVRRSLRRLEAKRGLLLHPRARRPWVVHPFSLSPASCWVRGKEKGWWAPCLYCAFGVAGCVGEDVLITTRLGGEAVPVEYRVEKGVLAETNDLFHFATPPRRWWDNVVHSCATFQPFRYARDVEDWCARHGIPRGETIPVARLFPFALDWYLPHSGDWRPRKTAEIRACFSRHGLVGPFWRL